MVLVGNWSLGLYRTSLPVRKVQKLSKSGPSRNRTFSFLDVRLLNFKKNQKFQKKIKFQKKNILFVHFLKEKNFQFDEFQ